jgi:hypothetical protein
MWGCQRSRCAPLGLARIAGCRTAARTGAGASWRGSGSCSIYLQYTAEGSKVRRLPLGPYDQEGRRCLWLPAARDRAAELSQVYRSGITDIHAHVGRTAAAGQAAIKAAEQAAARELQLAQHKSLKRWLEACVEYLEAQCKRPWPMREACSSTFQRHCASTLTTQDYVPRHRCRGGGGKGPQRVHAALLSAAGVRGGPRQPDWPAAVQYSM